MSDASTPQTALITGAARRIGRAIALDLAAHGWRVGIHYRRSRAEGLKRCPASQTIWSIKLYHRHEASNTIRRIVAHSIRQAR